MIRDPVMSDFLKAYDLADIVVVPMVENIFSGITVALEAVALGKPIVSSRTGGVPTYFGEDEIFYAPVGDPNAMRDVVLATDPKSRMERAQAAQRRFVQQDYSTRAVMARYAAITRRVMATESQSS
jgi:glycosyltransferase involved in cell wall biosynthesis